MIIPISLTFEVGKVVNFRITDVTDPSDPSVIRAYSSTGVHEVPIDVTDSRYYLHYDFTDGGIYQIDAYDNSDPVNQSPGMVVDLSVGGVARKDDVTTIGNSIGGDISGFFNLFGFREGAVYGTESTTTSMILAYSSTIIDFTGYSIIFKYDTVNAGIIRRINSFSVGGGGETTITFDELPYAPVDSEVVYVGTIPTAASAIIDVQDVADALKLAPAVGDPATGSVYDLLSDIDVDLTPVTNALADLQTDLGNPSADVTTIYAQIVIIKGYVDELESRITSARAGYLDNLLGGAVALNSTVAKETTLANATYGLAALLAAIEAGGGGGLTAQDVWEYVNRTLTSAITDETPSRDMAASGDIIGSVLATQASVDALSALVAGGMSEGILQNLVTIIGNAPQRIARGDIKTLVFNLGVKWNLTSKKVYFCVKSNPLAPDSTAIINRVCTIVSPPSSGVVSITTTSAETAVVGTYYAEVEVRNLDESSPQTAAQFKLVIFQDVRQ